MAGATRHSAASLTRASADGAGDPGVFGPGTMTWRIYRENVLGALGGGRALILQVAHPLVGAGVAAHSNYRERPWDRLFGTLDTVTAVTFGTREEAEEAAARVWNRHGRVRGVTPASGGHYPKGSPYDARDPDLAMWVHATLVDTGLLIYDRYVQPLSLAEREAFYEEQKRFAEMFGVPVERQPESYSEFTQYFDRVVEEELAVTDSLRDVIDAVFNPPLPLPLRPLSRPVGEAYRQLTMGLLPARVRHELATSWGPRRDRMVRASGPLVRTLLPLLPGLLRDFPRARAAARRTQARSLPAPPANSARQASA